MLFTLVFHTVQNVTKTLKQTSAKERVSVVLLLERRNLIRNQTGVCPFGKEKEAIMKTEAEANKQHY